MSQAFVCRGPRNLRHQRGQSTVEFVVIALALVPLLIGITLLGKYLDLMNATEQASRYVAFEGMARNSSNSWKSDVELAAEVRRRFFSNSDAPVKTNDTAGDFSAHRNPLWTDHTGRPFLDTFAQDVGVRTTIADRNAIATARPIANALNLPSANWYTGQVTVTPANVPEFRPFDGLNLNITRRTVLLADTWTAANAAEVRRRIEGGGALVYPIGQIDGVFNALGQIPRLVRDPAMRLGAFDWDIVPCDRLVSATPGGPGGCP
jgi:Flp pilus assembly protein TadG